MATELKTKESYRRAKKVEKIILLAWDSLESHLPYTHLKTSEGAKFHKDAIRQYIDIIRLSTELW